MFSRFRVQGFMVLGLGGLGFRVNPSKMQPGLWALWNVSFTPRVSGYETCILSQIFHSSAFAEASAALVDLAMWAVAREAHRGNSNSALKGSFSVPMPFSGSNSDSNSDSASDSVTDSDISFVRDLINVPLLVRYIVLKHLSNSRAALQFWFRV